MGGRIHWAIRRTAHVVSRLLWQPKVRVTPHPNLRRLGTEYGGWTFVEAPSLNGCQLISCGLGEDGSFDVEFARRYSAEVVIVDPTPRAISHFELIKTRIGLGRECDYIDGGCQPAEAYDCTDLSPSQLMLVAAALGDEVGTVRFYAPANPAHVSHSIVNYQNKYSTDTPFIEVPQITWEKLLDTVDVGRLAAVKMDIEGAEIAVLPRILESEHAPLQIMVEFDELNAPSKRAKRNYAKSDALLREHGYLLAHHEARADFLYVHASLY